jgi:hypothetical protein
VVSPCFVPKIVPKWAGIAKEPEFHQRAQDDVEHVASEKACLSVTIARCAGCCPAPMPPGFAQGHRRKTPKTATAGNSSLSPTGPSSCIGEHFAMLVTTLALATIARSTQIRSMDKDFPLESPYTTIAKGPIPAHVDARR